MFSLLSVIDRELYQEHLRSELTMDPDNFIDLTQLAILYFFEYEDDLCLEWLRSALVINNSYLPALVTAAELMFLTGHYSDAKFFYQKANLPEKVAKACYREGSLIEAAKYPRYGISIDLRVLGNWKCIKLKLNTKRCTIVVTLLGLGTG